MADVIPFGQPILAGHHSKKATDHTGPGSIITRERELRPTSGQGILSPGFNVLRNYWQGRNIREL